MTELGGAITDLRNRRVLIVEDESMVIMLMQDFLDDIGCEVAGVAARLKDAHDMAGVLAFDVAVLDVNLNGQQTFPLAREIMARGQAVVFSTGYGAGMLPPELRHMPILQKPFHQHDLERALCAALAGRVAPVAP